MFLTLRHQESDREKMIRVNLDGIETKGMGFKTIDGQERFVFSGVASDSSTDSYGDIVADDAWRGDGLAQFRRNGPLLYMHQRSFPLGAVTKMQMVKGTGLYARECQILVNDITSYYVDMIRAGFLKGLSVGFRVMEYEPLDPEQPYGGWLIKKAKLLELSVVTLPANDNGLIGDPTQKSLACGYMARALASGAQIENNPLSILPISVKMQDADAVIKALGIQTEEVAEATPEQDVIYLSMDEADAAEVKGDEDTSSSEDTTGTTEAPSSEKTHKGHFQDGVVYLLAPREDSDKCRVAVGQGDEVVSTLDPVAVRRTMGLLFTRRIDIDVEEKAGAFKALLGMYDELSLTAPEAEDGVDTPHGRVKFHEGEDQLTCEYLLATNTKAVQDGLVHFRRKFSDQELGEDVAETLRSLHTDLDAMFKGLEEPETNEAQMGEADQPTGSDEEAAPDDTEQKALADLGTDPTEDEAAELINDVALLIAAAEATP